MRTIRRRRRDDRGATAVEYAIILGGTAIGLVAIVLGLKATMGNSLTRASDNQAVVAGNSSASPSNPPSPPPPPAAPVVTSSPGNGSALIAWGKVDGATGYQVTCPGGTVTVGKDTLSASCGSLSNGTTYTVTVIAQGPGGNSFGGQTQVTPRTVPGAPSNVAADPGNGEVTLTWTAPNDGGAAISGYTVTPSPSAGTCTVTGISATCTGLTNGTSYDFNVVASNAAGSSAPGSIPLNVLPYGVGPNQFKTTFGTQVTETPTYSRTNGPRNYSVTSVTPQACVGNTATSVNASGAITFTPANAASASCLAGTAVSISVRYNYTRGNKNATQTDTFIFYVS